VVGQLRYEPNPRYRLRDGEIACGWAATTAGLPAAPFILAIDGPGILDWDGLVTALTRALRERGTPTEGLDIRRSYATWDEIVARTTSSALADDPDFAALASGDVEDLIDRVPRPSKPSDGVLVVFGPGAALVEHDVLWYVDVPKRYAEAAIAAGEAVNLGQPGGSGRGTTKRLFYIDWPLLDRHRAGLAGRIDRWVDLQDPTAPRSLDGPTLRGTMAELARQPFRTRPTFNTTPWGGHWAQRTLGLNQDARNTALGYELIAPESGVLIGDRAEAQVEIPFELIVSQHPEDVLGPDVHDQFGDSFPIRFDYLDTVDGGNLSVHCHPQADYMQRVFGWPYTQHESYYVVVGGEGRSVFLGLRGDTDIGAFEQAAHDANREGRHLDIEQYVQTFAADQHRLFMIPAGTPHGSSEGNVILEVSATPYLYSLRLYDWLRRDADGLHRPVHVDHAFANLDAARTGPEVERQLAQPARRLRQGEGWREELLGVLPDVFFEVRRMVLDPGASADDDTAGRFHVLNLVEGEAVAIETTGGALHRLNYAETVVVPAAVGRYWIRQMGGAPARIVKALVR
jgi:mannose-6-phosphate isomerase class I